MYCVFFFYIISGMCEKKKAPCEKYFLFKKRRFHTIYTYIILLSVVFFTLFSFYKLQIPVYEVALKDTNK